jgi:hypothetical protein
MERLRANEPESSQLKAPALRMSEPAILSLQRTAGNQAVCRAIASGTLAREDAAEKPISGVTVAPQKATLPLESGVAITAKAKPSEGAKYTLEAGTVSAAAGTTIDETSGVVSVDAKQPGGTLKPKATNAVSFGNAEFRVIEKPKDIASTASSVAGNYEAHFTHTFNSSGAGQSGLADANINEKFDATSAKTPFGDDFTLSANAAGSKGWFLSSAGAMKTVDKVSISTAGIDGGPFVKNASNPSPAKKLPQGFSMTQKFHARTLPSDKLEDAPFTTTEHVRELVEKDGKLAMRIGAGKASEHIPYVGPAVFRNAKADKATVEASPPKPKKGKWAQNEVQVSVDGEGKDPKPKFSLQGEKLGCSVSAAGVVKIGDAAGTITVRAGGAKSYDEVKITITAPAAPAAPAAPPAASGKSAALDPAVVGGEGGEQGHHHEHAGNADEPA